ncbi:MAG: hypothetical protein K2W95_34115 [Candidatus Obscuribacterales bacterium]|nr:hypothetical protein [Candidatus Obscuribacterales bacterium]
MSVQSIERLREIRRQRLELLGQVAVLNAEATDIGQLVCCAECKAEGFLPAPGGEENLPAGWVMSDCDNGGCIKCWSFWCPEHSGAKAQFECAACHCP